MERQLWGIEPGADFAGRFVGGLPQWLGDDSMETLARTTVFVNTRRAGRRLAEVFAARGNTLLPRIRLITSLAREAVPGLPPGSSDTRQERIFRALQLVRALIAQRPDLAPPASAFGLAESLASLFADIEASGQDLSCLDAVVDLDLAGHWAASRAFLQAVAPLWPQTPADMPMGSDIRQHAAVAALARHWHTHPPPDPVLIVGSTGSRATTAALMEAVAKLPRGAVVLPGLDTHLGPRATQMLRDAGANGSADHPQAILVSLAERLGVTHSAIPLWPGAPQGHAPRARLVSLALRPAPVTDEWRAEGPELVPDPAAALEGLTLVDASSDRVEAAAIALALRAALEAGKTSALVTPDATLSRRVAANLARWGITPDESAGQPLTLAPAGTLLQYILDAAQEPIPATALTALLKHPLVASGGIRTAYLPELHRLERAVLRECGPSVTHADVAEGAPEGWADWLSAALGPLAALGGMAPVADRVRALIAAADLVAAGPEGGPSPLWQDKADPKVRAVLDGLATAGEATETAVSQHEFRAILTAGLSSEQHRDEAYLGDGRIALWGTLESRFQSADVVVLGGLNEAIWPKLPEPDPWLSRPMRRKAGLPVPDEMIGLSAHDFQMAVCNSEVVLTRSARQGDSPAVASRWLTRMANLLGGLDGGKDAWAAASKRGAILAAQAEALDRAEPGKRAPRPAPAPPVAARPVRISASKVETLVRDPYEIYASDILKLRPLPEPGRLPDARDRGTVLHEAMEAFTHQTNAGLPPDAEALFARAVTQVMNEKVPWPAQARLWAARLSRGARDFVRTERERRALAQPHLMEVKATYELAMLSPPVTIVAKADRIDVSADGMVAIYDYKTSVPTDKQQYRYAVQLPIEAEMIERGAYDHVPVPSALHLELIALYGPEKRHQRNLSSDELTEIWHRVIALLSHYQDEAVGYASQYRPRPGGSRGDYDHLARRGEWAEAEAPVVIPVGRT